MSLDETVEQTRWWSFLLRRKEEKVDYATSIEQVRDSEDSYQLEQALDRSLQLAHRENVSSTQFSTDVGNALGYPALAYVAHCHKSRLNYDDVVVLARALYIDKGPQEEIVGEEKTIERTVQTRGVRNTSEQRLFDDSPVKDSGGWGSSLTWVFDYPGEYAKYGNLSFQNISFRERTSLVGSFLEIHSDIYEEEQGYLGRVEVESCLSNLTFWSNKQLESFLREKRELKQQYVLEK